MISRKTVGAALAAAVIGAPVLGGVAAAGPGTGFYAKPASVTFHKTAAYDITIKTVTLVNATASTVAISSYARSISAVDLNSWGTCGSFTYNFSVPAGGKCTITLYFAPTSADTTYSGDVFIYYNNYGSTLTIPVSGSSR